MLQVTNSQLENFNANAYANIIKQAAEKEDAKVVIVSSSINSKYLASLLAVELNAGYASIEIKDVEENSKAYHVIGKGWTTGITKFFFPVEDNYQTWFYKDSELPYHFRRRVSEGGHIKSRDIYFDQTAKSALIKDHKRKTEKTVAIDNVQDMISSFYKLRNYNISGLKIGDELKLMMFFAVHL